MKSTAIVYAIAAATLGFSALSFAQPDDRRGAREAPRQVQQHAPRHADQRDQRDQRDQNRYQRPSERRMDPRDDRRDYRADDRRDDRRNDRHFNDRDGRHFDYSDARRNDRRYDYNARSPDFRRGGYIPREYRNHQYVVVNYGAYRLSAPPRGHQWVQVGADYVLIAITTGLIAHIVLSN